MREIGVRELKTRASEILRDLREHRVPYTVTCRGRPVGVLVPVTEQQPRESQGEPAAWEDLIRVGEEVGRGWCSPLASGDLLSDLRR